MEYLRASLISLLAVVAAVSAVNEACNRMEDCLDAGTRCSNGMCRCWTEQGVAIAQIWSCSSDNACAASFPGHVCRISKGCARASASIGYCQLKSLAHRASAPEKPVSIPEIQLISLSELINKKLNEGVEVPPVEHLIANASSSLAPESSTSGRSSSTESASLSSVQTANDNNTI